jgi:hypothetical protein
MKFIKYDIDVKTGKKVVIYINDSEEVKKVDPTFWASGRTVETVPEQLDNGKIPVYLYNEEDNSVGIEYVGPTMDPMTVIQQQISDLTLVVADLMGGALQ